MEQRAEIGLLSRNILITSDDDNAFGCFILIASAAGSVRLQDVEIAGCGQQGTRNPALEIQGGADASIQGAVIHNSPTSGLAVNGSIQCCISNSVLFNVSDVSVWVSNSKAVR